MKIDEIKEKLKAEIGKAQAAADALHPSDGRRGHREGRVDGMTTALRMLEELPPETATAERDHLRAQVTELQAAGTVHVYERRGMLARCAERGRERNGDVEHHPRWLAGWNAADELLRRDVAPADPQIVGLAVATDAAKVRNLETELRQAARAADIERQRIWDELDDAKAAEKAARAKLEASKEKLREQSMTGSEEHRSTMPACEELARYFSGLIVGTDNYQRYKRVAVDLGRLLEAVAGREAAKADSGGT